MTVSEWLKTKDLYLTLVNEAGEKYLTDKVDYVKELANKTVLRWKISGDFKNSFPFTMAVLHSENKIFDAVIISPVYPNKETVIELAY